MRRLDRNRAVTFIDVAKAGGTCPTDRRLVLERLHAQEGDGPIVSGATAFAALWRAIPLLRPLGLAARDAMILRLLEWAYLLFLRWRPASPALREARSR